MSWCLAGPSVQLVTRLHVAPSAADLHSSGWHVLQTPLRSLPLSWTCPSQPPSAASSTPMKRPQASIMRWDCRSNQICSEMRSQGSLYHQVWPGHHLLSWFIRTAAKLQSTMQFGMRSVQAALLVRLYGALWHVCPWRPD